MLPITADEFTEVVSQVGYAVWQIQVLEEVLGCYLVLVHKVEFTTARSDVEAMFVKTEKRTLGQLFGAIRDTSKAPSTLLPRLDRFVDERNWLVHRSRHQNRTDLYSPAKRQTLIQRINAIADEALSLAKSFQQATEDHLIAGGMKKAKIDTRAAKIYHDWTTDAKSLQPTPIHGITSRQATAPAS
jgi:hypothetical protein